MRVLRVEEPNVGPVDVEWNVAIRQKYRLGPEEVAELEEGKIVWCGDTALTLEDPEVAG